MKHIFVALLLILAAGHYSFAGKSIDERFDDCIKLQQEIVQNTTHLISRTKILFDYPKELEDAPHDILKKYISKVERGLNRLYSKTEKTLLKYEYYTDELQDELSNVYIPIENSKKYHATGSNYVDEAAFENQKENLKSALNNFEKLKETISLYESNMNHLREVIIKMV